MRTPAARDTRATHHALKGLRAQASCVRGRARVDCRAMGNRALRRTIQALRIRIEEHLAKIEREQRKPDPDLGLIAHWMREVEAFAGRTRRLEDRLERQRRRGR